MRWIGRVGGLLLMIIGIGGLLFCIAGLVMGSQALNWAETAATNGIDETAQTLLDIDDGLMVASTSLGQADQTIVQVRSNVDGLTRTITDTLPAVRSLGVVVGDEMPATIRATQRALGSAQNTAQIVDGVLGAITRIGLISDQVYNPSVPLSSAIGQVSTSLNSLPPALQRMRGDLVTATGNLQKIQSDTARLSASIGRIGGTLSDARRVVLRYRATIGDLRAQLAELNTALPGWFRIARWTGALVLVWLAATQIGLISQGWDLVYRSRQAPSAPERAVVE